MSDKAQSKPLPVGREVRIDVPGGVVVAKVVENRGPIGVGGRELVRVAFDGQQVEIPREELRAK